MNLKELIADMDKAVKCSALELPESVYNDIATKWLALKTAIVPKNE